MVNTISRCAMWRIALSSLCLLMGCSPAAEDLTPSGASHSIAALKRICNGASELITTDIVVSGVVTANDIYGEFPNSIIIDDGDAAIELCCEGDRLFNNYPIGTAVELRCNGLWIAGASVGAAPEMGYDIGRITATEIVRHLRVVGNGAIPHPIVTTIDALRADMEWRQVKLSNLIFLPHPQTNTICQHDTLTGHTEWTRHTLQNISGTNIYAPFSSSVTYAEQPIPTCRGGVVALVVCYGSTFQLRVVNHGLFF